MGNSLTLLERGISGDATPSAKNTLQTPVNIQGQLIRSPCRQPPQPRQQATAVVSPSAKQKNPKSGKQWPFNYQCTPLLPTATTLTGKTRIPSLLSIHSTVSRETISSSTDQGPVFLAHLTVISQSFITTDGSYPLFRHLPGNRHQHQTTRLQENRPTSCGIRTRCLPCL